MDSIILSYAPREESFARHLAGFLEMNLPVAVSCTEAVMGPDLDLIEATGRALSADVALVLLSPSSIPKVWNRKTWEPVFFDSPIQLQTLIGFVLVSECTFPALLRQQRFFDATSDPLPAFRQIKRWLLRPPETLRPMAPLAPDLEEVLRAVADRPGSAAGATDLAVRFAGECADDFEAVYRIDCGGRSRAGILGDIGSELGLRLAGTTEQNAVTLGDWCASHRVLFVLSGIAAEDRDFAMPGGRASVIFTSPADAVAPDSIRNRTGDAVRRFQDALYRDTEVAVGLGWIAVRALKAQERLAEALEVLNLFARCAHELADTSTVARIKGEQYWIRNDLGYHDGPVIDRPVVPGREAQLLLEFGE